MTARPDNAGLSSANPYRVPGPALISFSGGRTSAFMLHEVLRAYGGQLPADVVVAFANTGKEREETLRFVHECAARWGVHVRWVERRPAPARFEEVGLNSASRNGEPFAQLLVERSFLPNVIMRFCTTELKIRPLKELALSLGWEHWVNVVGLRFDEGHRVLRQVAANATGKERWTNLHPLAAARVTRRDVESCWRAQPFDLQLRPYEGNCDLCFAKSRAKKERILREHPELGGWWAEAEARAGGTFKADYSVSDMQRTVAQQPLLIGDDLVDDGDDADCTGFTCGGESPAEIQALQRVFAAERPITPDSRA